MKGTNMSDTKATLCITSSCPHCPALITGLSQQLKQGILSHLEIINIEQDPQFAQDQGIRGVPWFRIAELTFEGAYTPSELNYWCEKAGSNEGIARYLSERLEEGKLAEVSALIAGHPPWLGLLLDLLNHAETAMQVKIGTGALIEERAGSPELQPFISQLKGLLESDNESTRVDACHYLSLIQDTALIPLFQDCLDDKHPEIREIAQEALEQLQS